MLFDRYPKIPRLCETLNIEDRSVGVILGSVCGDILGSFVRNMDTKKIQEIYGKDYCVFPEVEGVYSFQTAITLAIANSICQSKDLHPKKLEQKYLEISNKNHHRYCDKGIQLVIEALQKRESNPHKFIVCGPSKINDTFVCPMFIPPIAIAFRGCVDSTLLSAVKSGLLCTHESKLGHDGSFIFAVAITELLGSENFQDFDPTVFINNLLNATRTPVMRQRLLAIINFLSIPLKNASLDENEKNLLHLKQTVQSYDSTSTALWFFLRYFETPLLCVSRAVVYGGPESDIIGSMVCSLLGALYGTDWIPQIWFDNIENKDLGRDEIINLAKKLASLRFEYYAPPPEIKLK